MSQRLNQNCDKFFMTLLKNDKNFSIILGTIFPNFEN